MKLQILDYPPLDLVTDPADKYLACDTVIPPERARMYNAMYCDQEADLKNPLCSPVFASEKELTGLPEALILTAGLDSLHPEAEKYAAMLLSAGVPVTARCFKNSHHGFTNQAKDEYEGAHAMILRALKNAFRD